MTRDEILNMPAGRGMDTLIDQRFGRLQKDPSPIYEMPHYSTDIAAAWEVHQAMLRKLFSVRRKYFAELQEVVSKEYGQDKVKIAYPDVFLLVKPVHFCRAALLAVLELE